MCGVLVCAPVMLFYYPLCGARVAILNHDLQTCPKNETAITDGCIRYIWLASANSVYGLYYYYYYYFAANIIHFHDTRRQRMPRRFNVIIYWL